MRPSHLSFACPDQRMSWSGQKWRPEKPLLFKMPYSWRRRGLFHFIRNFLETLLARAVWYWEIAIAFLLWHCRDLFWGGKCSGTTSMRRQTRWRENLIKVAANVVCQVTDVNITVCGIVVTPARAQGPSSFGKGGGRAGGKKRCNPGWKQSSEKLFELQWV